MASRHRRVQVSRDPDLEQAIRRGRAALGGAIPTSRIVRELALRGAEALESDQVATQRAADFALSVADGTSGLDLAGLKTARDRSWDR
jgi:hypothetical protein